MTRITRHHCHRTHRTPQGLAYCALRTRAVSGSGSFGAYDATAARNPVVILTESKQAAYNVASGLGGYEVIELITPA